MDALAYDTDNDLLITYGDAIKAAPGGRVSGYLVRFSDENTPDADGDFFTAATDFDILDGERATIYYHHGLDAHIGPRPIGSGSLKVMADGVWIDGQIDINDQQVKVYHERYTLKGRAGWSSGSLPHLVVKERRPNGANFIARWPLGKDASITPIPAGGLEANRVYSIKSLAADTGLADLEPEATQDSGGDDAHPAVNAANHTPPQTEAKTMSDDKFLTIEQVTDAMKSVVAPMAARLDALEREPVNAVTPAVKSVNVALNSDAWRYDGISIGDLAMAVELLRQTGRSGLSRGVSDAAVKALAMRLESDEGRRDYREAYGAMKARTPGIKANEIAQSTLANYGDEWVGTAYGTELWNTIRVGTPLLSRIMAYAVPQRPGAETMSFPLEGGDPTWYKVAQASDLTSNPGGTPSNTVTASKMGTAQQSRAMAKIGARTLWTMELDEDTVVNYVSELRRQLIESGMETLESLVIDGDTEAGASANINDIAGTPAGTEYWLALNGFRKLALVTNTANSRSGGTLGSDDFLATAKLMGIAGRNAVDKMRTAFVIDLNTMWKALELSDVKTRDVFSGATIEGGNLTRIFGYDVIATGNMHKANQDATYGLKANTAGKLDLDTASNNTTGSILAVRFDQWRPGYRRQMTMETTRIPAADATEIVALMRFGMIYRDIEASAITYNLTV